MAVQKANFTNPNASRGHLFAVDMGGLKIEGTMAESARFVSEFFNDVSMDEILGQLRANGNYTILEGDAYAIVEKVEA